VKELSADVQALPVNQRVLDLDSAARLRRRQPAASQERGRHQGGPAESVLQYDAGDSDQPGWRDGLESDQGSWPQITS
jgi:hypothetical protein